MLKRQEPRLERPAADPRVERKRERMASIMTDLIGRMQRSINHGVPFTTDPVVQSLHAQFEGYRLRVEDFERRRLDREQIIHDNTREALAVLNAGSAKIVTGADVDHLKAFAEQLLISAGVIEGRK